MYETHKNKVLNDSLDSLFLQGVFLDEALIYNFNILRIHLLTYILPGFIPSDSDLICLGWKAQILCV